MAVVVNIVTRLDDRALKQAQKEMSALIARTRADQTSLAGSFLRTGTAMSKVGKSTESVGKALTKGLTVPILGAVGAVVALGKSSLSAYTTYAKSLDAMSRVTGMTSKQVSLIGGQMQLLGIDASRASTGMTYFSRNLDKARQGGKAQVEIFKRLGVSLKDSHGKWKDVGTVLTETRSKLASTKDSAERMNAALTLFGRGGKDLIKWYTASDEQVAKFNRELQKMGLVMGKGSTKAFRDYIEKQHELETTFLAVRIALGQKLIPILQNVLPQVTRWLIKHIDDIKRGFASGVQLVLQAGPLVGSLLKRLAGFIDRLSAAYQKLTPHQKEMAGKLILMAAAMGPVLTFVGKLTGGIGTLLLRLGGFGAVYRSAFVHPLASGIGPTKMFFGLLRAGVRPSVALKGALNQTGPALQGIAKGLGFSSVATMGWTAVIIAAIAALVLLYMHSERFRKVVNKIASVLKTVLVKAFHAVVAVIEWTRKHWRGLLDAFLLAMGPIGWFLDYIVHHWDKTARFLGRVWDGLKKAWHVLWNDFLKWTPIGQIISLITAAWERLGKNTEERWNAILRTVARVVNAIGGIINATFGRLIGVHVPTVTWGTPHGSTATSGASRKSGQHLGDAPYPARRKPRTGDAFSTIAGGVTGAVDWLGGKAGDLMGVLLGHMPKLPSLPWPLTSLLPALLKRVVDALKKRLSAGIAGGAAGGKGAYGWAYALARRFGLVVTSTFRPGAITASGNISDHSVYGRAADIAGPASRMAALWRYLVSTAGAWKQAIYQHSILNYGQLGYYGPSDHFDHVHVARAGVGDYSGPTMRAAFAAAGPVQQDIHIHVHLPGGTALVGEAERVGEVLAPYVERAITRSQRRKARSS